MLQVAPLRVSVRRFEPLKWLPITILVLVATGCNINPLGTKAGFFSQGERYFAQNEYQQALLKYQQAIAKDPMFGEAYHRAGLCATRLGDWGEAIQNLVRAVELLPGKLEVYNDLANVYLFVYEANKNVRNHILLEMQALSARLRQRFPGTFEDLRLQGYTAVFRGDNPTALRAFAAASELNPNDPGLALAYLQTLWAAGRIPEGDQFGEKALARQPGAPELYNAMFWHYRQHNRFVDAERILVLRVKNNPKDIDAYLNLAAWYATTNRRPEVAKIVGSISSDTALLPVADPLVGDFYLRIGMPAAALENYQRCIAGGGAHKRLCKKRMVEALAQLQRLTESEQKVKELLSEDPQEPEAIAMQASLTVIKQDNQQAHSAIEAFRSVMPKLPGDFVMRYQYARALLAAGNVSEAIVQCQESLKLRPDYLWARVLLAHIVLGVGRLGVAIAMTDEISNSPGLYVPFITAGQRPEQQTSYEPILALKASADTVIKELTAELQKRTAAAKSSAVAIGASRSRQ